MRNLNKKEVMTNKTRGEAGSTAPPSYPQNWRAYNQAQCEEKQLFLELLSELTSQIIPPERGRGRPPASFGDIIFCTCVKSYNRSSARRTISDLFLAQRASYIRHAPHFNTLLKYLNDANLTPILQELIHQSSLPLKQVEIKFTIDASGFSTRTFERWLDVRYDSPTVRRIYKKAHVMSGVVTNIVSYVEVTEGHRNDCNLLPHLVKETGKNFMMSEISADMAYSSRYNLNTIIEHGAVPYIPFKKNAKPRAGRYGAWNKMYWYFHRHQDEFMGHYHLRSNAESVFSMIKRKFGGYLMCKSDVGQENEVLCKILCHNIVVLIHEMVERDLHVQFLKGS